MPPHCALCSQLMCMKWIAWSRVRVYCFSAVSFQRILPAVAISHHALIQYIPFSPRWVSQSAFYSRDNTLGPLCYDSLVFDCHCFLFTGCSRLLNTTPTSPNHLRPLPSLIFQVLCCSLHFHSSLCLTTIYSHCSVRPACTQVGSI